MDARSSMIARYISFVRFIFLASSTVFTGLPSGPDWSGFGFGLAHPSPSPSPNPNANLTLT
jgi:hypothetical protein